MTTYRTAWLATSLVAGLAAATPATAGMAVVGAAGTFRVPVVSLHEQPFLTVVRQQYDYSCGSAALATLLHYHYGQPTTEAEVFEAMYAVGDKQRIQEFGFSLLDMKLYLEQRGLRADGFRISVDKLAEVGVPAIALIEVDGYRHFVVVKGIQDGTVLVGDPATGLETYTMAAFEQVRVDDIVFVIRDRADVARASFNQTEEWDNQPAAAPLGEALARRSLADHGVLARLPAQFRFTQRENVR